MTDRPNGMPADTPDYMAPAWVSCMSWAIGHKEIRAEFEAETGNRWVPPKNGLDKMIDAATGNGGAYVAAFIEWANAKIWGAMDGDPNA